MGWEEAHVAMPPSSPYSPSSKRSTKTKLSAHRSTFSCSPTNKIELNSINRSSSSGKINGNNNPTHRKTTRAAWLQNRKHEEQRLER